ncbi:hypothetical protein VZT92_022928 [Zoarces viviparus]|uniref:Uncharacterized protein n=1 Tax=Zoarces viviparus TaxID=48416 RepID=A0AAW1E7A1_ZOAVI
MERSHSQVHHTPHIRDPHPQDLPRPRPIELPYSFGTSIGHAPDATRNRAPQSPPCTGSAMPSQEHRTPPSRSPVDARPTLAQRTTSTR